MTDYLPPPPAEIVIDTSPENPRAVAFAAQGGNSHTFIYQPDGTNDLYLEGSVYQFKSLRDTNQKYSQQVESFEYALKEYLKSEEIDPHIANEFADIFGISLTREVQFCVQVEFTFCVEMPLDADPDDVPENVNFEVTAGYGSDIDINEYDANIIHSTWDDVS